MIATVTKPNIAYGNLIDHIAKDIDTCYANWPTKPCMELEFAHEAVQELLASLWLSEPNSRKGLLAMKTYILGFHGRCSRTDAQVLGEYAIAIQELKQLLVPES